MTKNLTMQDILNNKELLNIFYSFREESEIKDFCRQNFIEVSSTTLYNLKKSLESQLEQIENADKPLTIQTLKDIAGGSDSDACGSDFAKAVGLNTDDWANFLTYSCGGTKTGDVVMSLLTNVGSIAMQLPMAKIANEANQMREMEGMVNSLVDKRLAERN